MSCHACEGRAAGGSEYCPTCGAALEGNGCTDDRPGRLLTDGGQSTGGGGNGRSVNERPDRSGGSDIDVGAIVESLPLKGGVTIGVVATLLPWVIITLGSYVPLQRDEFGISGELYATIIGFGPGERFVDLFIGGSDITALSNVRPEDYPSVATELDAVLDTLIQQPEALLLPLYLLAPLLCYIGGRYLAKKHAAPDAPVEHVQVGVGMVLGALPVTILLGAIFGVQALGPAVVLGGFIVPLIFGTLGGLTVYAFRELSWTVSKGYGWLAGLIGLVLAVILVPLPTAAFGGIIEIDLAQRVLFAIAAFIGSTNFAVGAGLLGILLFLFILVVTGFAGFARSYRAEQATETVIEGARIGASVALGLVAAVALAAVALPFLQIVIQLPFGMNAFFAAVLPDVAKFTSIVALSTIYACLVAGAGGGLAVWYRDRENTQFR